MTDPWKDYSQFRYLQSRHSLVWYTKVDPGIACILIWVEEEGFCVWHDENKKYQYLKNWVML